MRFLLYARGGGGTVLKKVYGEAPLQGPTLILLYTYTIFDREKVPLLYTLF